MPISMLFPLFYLCAGLALARAPVDVKAPASALLTKVVISFVIVYNIATSPPGLFAVLAGTVVIMAVMLALGRLGTRDPVRNLCFCYLNIGWLGLPVATALFGEGAASLFIAAYVGGSIFGNSIGAGMMAATGDWRARLRQTLLAPPVWSLLIGLLCMPLAPWLTALQPVYGAMKFLMSFLGMAILGIWLGQTPLRLADFRRELLPSVLRMGVMAVLMTGCLAVARRAGLALVVDNRAALYLICLLPPAANIIVLETHYLRTGRSAPMIAAGTCLSIGGIAGYVFVSQWF